jgi:hypothetical protein
MLGGNVTVFLAASTLKLAGGASGSITCLTQTIMFITSITPLYN